MYRQVLLKCLTDQPDDGTPLDRSRLIDVHDLAQFEIEERIAELSRDPRLAVIDVLEAALRVGRLARQCGGR